MLNFFVDTYFQETISLDIKKKEEHDNYEDFSYFISTDEKYYLDTHSLNYMSIFIKFKKNYKYFSYINCDGINYKYTSCTKRYTEKNIKKMRVFKNKLNFEEFLNIVFINYKNLDINRKSFLIFSNFLIFFFKSFENFFKKKIITSKKPEYLLFFFKKFFYKFKKVKSCKKNLQKRLLYNFRKKENFLY